MSKRWYHVSFVLNGPNSPQFGSYAMAFSDFLTAEAMAAVRQEVARVIQEPSENVVILFVTRLEGEK
jgi:hypothetical protein